MNQMGSQVGVNAFDHFRARDRYRENGGCRAGERPDS